jgi:hypothetical protein
VLPKLGSYSRAKSELRDKFKKRIVQLDRFDGTLMVGIKADDSGVFPKTQIKTAAQDAFGQVYKDAAYAPTQMIIQFHGPLVDKATGKESDGIWAVYSMTRARAAQIQWANQDQIEWDSCRTMIRNDL